MTEDTQNNTKNEQEAVEEDEQFKVVVPEAERVEMPAIQYAEQPDYLKVFANFYISKFEESDLEIMDTFDGNHDVVEINIYITNNAIFSRKTLIKHILNVHADRFKDILANIKEKTGTDPESMKTYADWDNWYDDQRNQITQTMS